MLRRQMGTVNIVDHNRFKFSCQREAGTRHRSTINGGMDAHLTLKVQRYAPALQRCSRRHLKPTNDSWRLDETYVRVKGKWRTSTGRWTRAERPWIFSSRLSRPRSRPSAFSQKHWAERTIPRRG